MVLQGVGNRFDSFYDRLWKPEEKRETKLVFIGRLLEENKIKNFLDVINNHQ
jgi:cobalamin biosynthesis protein CobW